MADQVLIQPGTVVADDIIAHNTLTVSTFQTGTLTIDKATANIIEGTLEVTGAATLDNLTATSVAVQNDLIAGDLTVEGNNTELNGEVMEILTTESVPMVHGKWYNNANSYIALTVSPDVNSGTVKTCYIVTPVSVTLTGATWLYSDIDMTDTTRTYVIALQQIGSTTVHANIAYSFQTA